VCALFRSTGEHPGKAEVVELWEEKTWLQRHRGPLWRAAALALWGGTMGWFFWAGKLILYIRPIYHPLSLDAGLLLVALAVRTLLDLLLRHCSPTCCLHGHEGEQGHVAGRAAAVVVVLPLIINVLVPSTGLTSYAASKRLTGSTMDYSALASQMSAEWKAQLARARELAQEYPELTIAQLLTLATQEPERAAGGKFSVVGFVYHGKHSAEKKLPEDVFLLVRFRMWCCAADAVPMYLPVHWVGAAKLEADRWVRVRGRLTFTQQKGRRIPRLEADHIDLIKPPHNQYM